MNAWPHLLLIVVGGLGAPGAVFLLCALLVRRHSKAFQRDVRNVYGARPVALSLPTPDGRWERRPQYNPAGRAARTRAAYREALRAEFTEAEYQRTKEQAR